MNYCLPCIKQKNDAFANAAICFLHHNNLLLVTRKIALDFQAVLTLSAQWFYFLPIKCKCKNMLLVFPGRKGGKKRSEVTAGGAVLHASKCT